VNLSVSGMLVRMPRQYRVGESLEWEIEFLIKAGMKTILRGVGEVVRSENLRRPLTAIRFDIKGTSIARLELQPMSQGGSEPSVASHDDTAFPHQLLDQPPAQRVRHAEQPGRLPGGERQSGQMSQLETQFFNEGITSNDVAPVGRFHGAVKRARFLPPRPVNSLGKSGDLSRQPQLAIQSETRRFPIRI
jgi:hypothetical protein